MTEPAPLRRILHCDMDCFYAAVHARDDPRLAGRPVVVGGDPDGRGVVAAASYEARAFGIRSAMPAARARRLCPRAVFLPPDFPRYKRESEKIFAIYREITPVVETVSLDEAYLDVSAHLAGFASATEVARAIRRRVREERRLNVSIGVGPSRLIAKIASDHGKPDGLVVVPPARTQTFLDPLPVRRLHGVGPATEAALASLGVASVADLRAQPLERLLARFKSHGRTLFEFARGIDERPVTPFHERKSIGNETTYARDLTTLAAMEAELDRLAAELENDLRRHDLTACTLTLKVRYSDFVTVTRAHTSAVPTDAAGRLAGIARGLLRRTEAGGRAVRLLGLSASTLVPARLRQLELFSE